MDDNLKKLAASWGIEIDKVREISYSIPPAHNQIQVKSKAKMVANKYLRNYYDYPHKKWDTIRRVALSIMGENGARIKEEIKLEKQASTQLTIF